jgi:hypothetical protein
VEKLGKPTAPIITNMFVNLARTNALKRGMPNQRFTFLPHPVWGKTPEELQRVIQGKDPVTGKPVMQEIVEALTRQLSDDEKKTGYLERSSGPRMFPPDTPENLQQFYLENGMTDYLPIILPTAEKVAAMLKATSHRPEEVVGRMAAGAFEPWEYTVEQVAVNAVMAGAKPEYFPAILALASSGVASLYSSTNSFARAVVFNGPIRDEIGMNYGIGAMGPFSQANATIGRVWTLISKNLGNGGIPGETYLGSQGNNLNFNNIVIAENEAASPWAPLSVQMGFKPGENVLSIFAGLGLHQGHGAKAGGTIVKPQYDRHFSSILGSLTGFFGALVVCDPLIAKSLKEQGYDSKEQLIGWLHKNTLISVEDYKDEHFVSSFDQPRAEKGIEPYASWFKLSNDTMIPRFAKPSDINIVVTGGETQAFFQAGNLRYTTSVSIDKWK